MASPDNISRRDVGQAVKKLLSLVYYDKSNTNLHLRKQIADYFFDSGREQLIDRILRLVKGKLSVENILSELSYQVIPKGVEPKYGDKGYVSNNRESEEYDIQDVNLIIDAPLEIHVISVLWLLKFGYKIDAQLPDTCYGNRLVLNEDKTGVEDGRALLKPYIRQYQKWRDEGIKIAKTQLDQDKDVAFVNLDISSYYYHVRLDWESLEVDDYGKETLVNLNKILFRVHKKYSDFVFEDFPQKSSVQNSNTTNNVILPLGLVSSYTLANKYLDTFDTEVEEKVRPLYYGRYVDDIIIVISRPKLTENLSTQRLKKLIEEYGHIISGNIDKLSSSAKFIINNLSEVLRVEESREEEFTYLFRSDMNRLLSVKNSKVLIYEFVAGQSQSVLEKLIKDIEERSSEFRFLPTDEDANFDTDAYELLYDDSHGKPRTLKDYKESKLGLATYLYRRSAVALWADSTELKDESDKILAFFSGSNLIDYFQYWERVATYLVIADRKSELKDLIQNAIQVIENCVHKNSEKTTNKLRETLRLYLSISVAQAFTLDPKIFCDKWFEKRIVNVAGDEWHKITEKTIVSLRWIWFVRNFLTPHPLLEFTKWARSDDINKLPSLINKIFSWKEIDSDAFKLSSEDGPFPRFIRLYECSLYLWYKVILKADDEGIDEAFTHKFIENAEKLFFQVNGIDPEKNEETLFESVVKEVINDSKLTVKEIHIDQKTIDDSEDKTSDSICVGLANMKVDWRYQASYSLRGRPIVNRERYNRISKILNRFLDEKPSAALSIFPEVSIPHDFVNLMTSFTKRHQKGLVYGTEHINTGNVGYNFIITTLPIKLDQRNDALFIPRIKNHYSHEEKAQIRANNLQLGSNSNEYYHLFKWRNLYFTTFYCFELADIEHRSFFRSKIDLLAVSEYNKDTNYFSNLVESTARDLNVIVAQANSCL